MTTVPVTLTAAPTFAISGMGGVSGPEHDGVGRGHYREHERERRREHEQ